jgi:hypothetical protein
MTDLISKTGFSYSYLWYRPIKTQRRRRMFVAFMYGMLLLFFWIMLVSITKDKPLPWFLLFWVLVIAPPALGGSRYFGPVKKFEDPKPYSEAGYALYRSLNPWLRKKRSMPAWANDEFDLQRRNQAHYSAYRILRCIYPALAAALWVLLRYDATSVWANRVLEAALLPSIVAFWWLPQAIILWTEQDLKEETAGGPQLVDTSAPQP